MTQVAEPLPHERIDQYDLTLRENTHPPDWQNPRPAGRYNLVVIGAGTAGLVSAAGAAMLGARVALIEKNLMGGDCLNFGCVPSKSLIAAARAAHAVRRAANFGIELAEPPEMRFHHVMERVRRIRSNISEHDSAKRFAALGVDVYFGQAQFVSPRAVEVAGTRLDFSKAIIATGARAAALPVPGLEKIGYLTNETVFSIREVPRRLIVVGSGPIGCELGQAFRQLGSYVTMLSASARLLPKDDPDAAMILQKRFEQEGIQMRFNARILRGECSASGKVLVFDRGHGEETAIADEILVAVGRAPNVEGLNLEAAGVKCNHLGVLVDERLRTSNSRIFAAGDIASRYQFTHAAEALARIALQNAIFFGRKKASALVVPWATFTDPEVAHVGLDEKQARDLGLQVKAITLPFADNDRAATDSDTSGFARVLVNVRNGRLLGATLVGSHAGEMIGELVLAIQKKMKISELSAVIHPYPTRAEIIKRLGDESMRSRLKPWIKRLLSRFFAWSR
jgi:pyruvate/2-oxoglutarate dehydrogenase complex dihydrolipoamide dehydrogenase (E3) component